MALFTMDRTRVASAMNDLSHSFIARRDLSRHHIVIFDVETKGVIKRCGVIVLTIAKHSQRPDATSDGNEKTFDSERQHEAVVLLYVKPIQENNIMIDRHNCHKKKKKNKIKK